jgi:hypothetical protein
MIIGSIQEGQRLRIWRLAIKRDAWAKSWATQLAYRLT